MAEGAKWRLKQGRKVFFSLTSRKLQQWISEGKVTADDLVWREGSSRAKRIKDIEEFKSLKKT